MLTKTKAKIFVSIIIIISILLIFIGENYSDNNNHYVVDVIKESAESSDDNLKLTESIVKNQNEEYFDSKKLKYQVDLKNIMESNVEKQVAILVDSSYSMSVNDTNNIVKTKAIEVTQGILSKVAASKISISNNSAVKLAMTNSATNIASTINGLTSGDGNDSNTGLDKAYSSFKSVSNAANTLKKYIIVFTDSTDNVKDKMQSLTEADPNLKIISVLVDMTSTSYINNKVPVCGEVYLLPSEVDSENLQNSGKIYSAENIYDELNCIVKGVNLQNEFSEELTTYFDISDFSSDKGTVTRTETGYTWNIDKLNVNEKASMTYTVTLKTDMDIDSGVIFNELCTNKEQKVNYMSFENADTKILNGTDSREGTESTVIKICQGYDMKIKAVNESNKDLAVEGVQFKVEGINEEGEKVCQLTKTTDAEGYITITADDAKALRGEGKISYTVTPYVNLVGYSETDSVTFNITSSKVTRKLTYDNNESKLEGNIDELRRTVEIVVPINSQRIDFELRTEELNNSDVTISGCEFELIQPKLNNKYEMNVLSGETDENGIAHFAPTVMTKDGTYNYILRQVSAPNAYDITDLTLIEITYKDGKITNITKQFNPNVETKLCDDKENHVLITVGNECVEQNPFDLQINLEDNEDKTKLEGVTYLVTTTNSNSQVRNEYVTTDENGQINTKVYGTGYINIKITEQSPKIGYIADTTTKVIVISRVNDEIIVWDNAQKVDIDIGSEDKNIIVNLASTKKEEQNVVRVSLLDAEEQDVTVGKNVVYYLKDTETEQRYGPAVSNKNGELSFILDTKSEGQHAYVLEANKETVPSEYDSEKIEDSIRINLTFDKTGYIIEENVVNNETIIDEHYSKVLGEGSIEYTCFITIGYQLNDENLFDFKVQLSDKDETTKPIEGTMYNIDIEWDVAGVTKTKTIKERKTNASGLITTRIMKADQVRIEVTEVGASAGYNCDNTTQEIFLSFNNQGIKIDSQRPYDRGAENKEEPKQGAYINTDTIVYQHLNRKRNSEDTYLNLTVNKIDMNGAYKDGVVLGFESSLLVNEKDEKLENMILTTGEQGSTGTVSFDYKQYIDNIKNSDSKEHTIRVPGIGTEAQEIVYDLNISEMILDANSSTGYSIKKGTTVKLRLIFRNKEDGVQLTNVETIYGNRLVKSKEISSVTNGDNSKEKEIEEALGVYLCDVTLDLYTDYDDAGNLSLDFKKQDNNENELSGAKYDMKIVNPDSTVLRKTITIENGEDSSAIEISGVTVNVGSMIYLTEIQAPIGYALNNNTETLEVKEIGEDGSLVLEQIDKTYTTDRLSLSQKTSTPLNEGIKNNYEIKLIDYQFDTFDFGIKTLDSKTGEGVQGNKFDICSSLGAQNNIVTDAEGKGNIKIGGNVENKTITYTISNKEVAEYYKELKDLINVNVVFDISGNVDSESTMAQQTDTNYGKTWIIEKVETNGKIEIKILIDRQDPLVVNVETVDKISNKVITDVEYKITESQVLPATGKTPINVGYAINDGIRTYNLFETNINNSYASIENKSFTLTYTNEKITNATITSETTEDKIQIVGNKEIKITVYAEPKVPIEIRNSYYFDKNIKLQGSNFEVTEESTSEVSTGTTNSEGITGIYSGILGTNENKTYKIRQTAGCLGYATVEDFYVKVAYDQNREITSAILVNEKGEEITNKFIEVSTKKNSEFSTYNGNTKGIIDIQIFNYPEFKMNIEDVDRRDDTVKLAGAEYSISSKYTASDNTQIDFTKTDSVKTNESGIGIAHLDKTKENTIVTYTLKEVTPATGYQSLGTDINIVVTYNSDGYVEDVRLGDSDNLNKIASVKKEDSIVNPEDNLKIYVQVKNNPILKINLTAEDSVDHNSKIKDVGLQIVSKYNEQVYSNSSATNRVNKGENPETCYTDINGYTSAYMDRTLDSSDMYYTIKEVQKTAGYDWADEDIIIKISYDANGKISTITPVQGETTIDITSFNSDEFEINMEIYNEEIKEFGVHLSAVDTYDKNKKLNDIKVEAYLSEGNNYAPDGKYELSGDNALIAGADRDNNGTPDLAYGEDYKTIGKYVEGAGTRTLRLVIKNDSHQTKQSGYYLTSTDGTSNGNNIGYYRGSKYNSDAKYQTVEYQYLINVTFDDEGKITNSKIQSGLTNSIGWLTDDRYLEVDNTNYKLNITMKFFPMLDLKLSAMDNFTYQNEIGQDGKPIALNGSKYLISSERHSETYTQKDEFVTAGYIGYGNAYGRNGSRVYGNIYEDRDELFAPIENNYSRLFYIYEEAEPKNHQKYTDRYLIQYQQRLVAIIQVTFNEYGDIDYDNSIVRKVDDKTIEPYMDENGNNYLSSNNLKEYNYYYDKTESNRNINFYIGYALTTKITVKTVDDISNNPIANVKMLPFCSKEENANTSYEFDVITYRYTNQQGLSGWTYWGAAEKDNIDTYVIGSTRDGNNYNGYLLPSDMASGTLGGSGKQEDYYAKLDITYDSNGKISKVQSLGSDLWGDNNAVNITWNSETGNVYIDMLYSRKLQTKLNKVDYYDNTINKLSAQFKIVSNKGLNTTINSDKMAPLGKVYKNTTVKYTVSETQVPNGYYPISGIIEYYVTFNENGNVSKNRVKSESDYFEVVNTSEKTENISKTIADLNINIKNKPSFNISAQVIDKFYKNDGLADVYLKAYNSKGDLASGNPQTDSRGYANMIVGPVYPNETVTYYVEQNNTADGYYENTTKIQLQVKYNEAGKIEDYKIISGNDIINNFNNSKYMNTRTISMQIMNMPKDLNIGLYKYDITTNNPMAGVSFTITKTDINSGNTSTKDIITNEDGSVISQIDTFNSTLNGKTIKYKIHENETPASFRTMEDVVFLIRYNADGSMTSCNQIENDNGILNTKVSLDMATNGVIRYLNNKKVHFNVKVPNDNAFDLIIKNEDINYSGLGIEATKYDISIDGVELQSNPTDEKGRTIISDITKSGEITLNISEREVGEGYKDDINNKISIKLQKGVDVYSLNLNSESEGFVDNKNAITEKAIVSIDEEYGKIQITFKNETKTELTVIKQDINTKERLQNTEFEVIAQQVDNNGNAIGEEKILTTEENKITDDKGELYIELGVAPQSEIWKYTFKEITAPEGYNSIIDLTMTVTYDQYGRIIKPISSKDSRLKAIMEDDNYNCHSMYAIIYNGDVTPAYQVKVVTEDDETGKRINGSKIYLNITDDETGNLITVEPKTVASSLNGTTSETKNLGIDGTMLTDEELEMMQDKPIIMEKGLVYIDNIDYEGTINIEISQKETAEGYIFGSHRTDGNIKINTTYIPHLDEDPTTEFTVIENDGFDVIIDNVNRIITVKMLNESQVLFNILNKEYGSNNKGIEGTNFNITAEIQTATDSIPTEVNVTTPLTDNQGKTKGIVGKAYAGKTVLYKLRESSSTEYYKIDDIEIEVKYDSKGYIKYCELLSSENFVNINEEETKGRTISITVQNRKEIPGYAVCVEKHAMDTEEDENAYGKVLEGAKYKITVKQENSGVGTTTWTDTTDENGMIEGLTFEGFGYVTITLEEITAPDGYQIDTLREIRLYRDVNTGIIEEIIGNINFEHNEDFTKVILKPIDAQADDKYTLVVNKVSTATGKFITSEQTQFEAVMQKEDEDGNIIYKDTIENIYTNKMGKAIIDNLSLPDEPGNYKLILTEITAPDGYKKLQKPVELNVNFQQDSQDKIIISTVSEDYDKISISKVTKQLIAINCGNDVDEDIKDDEYSLDITKVNAETNEAIEAMSLFKVWLPDENNTAVYAETCETLTGPGKLDYCYIEQDKDYTARLTHMKKPKEEGTYKYVFREILAPEGYRKIDEDLELTLEFKLDRTTNELKINKATSSNEKYLRVNTETPCSTDTKFSIDILNYVTDQKEFTIHYDANDNSEGTTIPNDQIKQKDVEIILDTMQPERQGYIFKGWSTLPDSTEAQFKPGDKFTSNQDITLYAIWQEKLYVKSEKYKISNEQDYSTDINSSEYVDGDQFIFGIKPAVGEKRDEEKNRGTNIEDFKQNIETNADNIEIIKIDNEKVIEGDLIGTGMKLILTKGNQKIELTIIVFGDLDGNGILIGSDKTRASKYINLDDTSIIDSINQKLALDVNLDGIIRASDLSILRQVLSNDDSTKLEV